MGRHPELILLEEHDEGNKDCVYFGSFLSILQEQCNLSL